MEAEMKAGKVVPKHLPPVSADAVPVNPPPPQMNNAQRNNYNQHKRGRDGEPYKFFTIEVASRGCENEYFELAREMALFSFWKMYNK